MSRSGGKFGFRMAWAGCAAVAMAALAGCGGRSTYPVEGKVVWEDGTPAKELAGGSVHFDLITEDEKEKVSPHGNIREDGSYQLTTFKEGDGAPPGKYRVSITPVIWTPGLFGDKPEPPPVMDRRFQQFESAKLEAVVEAKTNNYDVKVDRARKR